jgi:hypothetical protein
MFNLQCLRLVFSIAIQALIAVGAGCGYNK